MENDQSKSSAKEVVLSFIDNLNKENFDAARECISDGLQFKGVMGSRDSGDAYMKDMEKMRMKYDLKKVFEDGNDVCVFSDITQAGVTFLCCGWYHVKAGKIDTYTVLFDPRPLLALADKKS